MATSGTVGATVVQVDDLFGHALRRCKILPVTMTLEDADVLRRLLFFILSDLSNQGINYWAQERSLLPMYPNQPEVVTPVGTVDVLEMLHRDPTRLSGGGITVTSSAGGLAANVEDGDVETVLTQAAPLGNVQWDFGAQNAGLVVKLVGYLPGATSTLDLIFEASSDGVTWFTVLDEPATAYVDRIWVWYELFTPRAARFFRVRATSGTIVAREIFVSEIWRELIVTRMSRDVYSSLPNKRSQPLSRPLQYWLDRREVPVIVLWPEPRADDTFNVLHVFRHRHVEDIGALSNTIEVPQRWLPWCMAELARQACMELPRADLQRYPVLEAAARQALANAQGEERDNSPVNIGVRVTPYTR